MSKSTPNRLSKGVRVNLYLDGQELEFYRDQSSQLGLPLIAWIRALLRMQTGWRPPHPEQVTVEAPATKELSE